MRFKSIEEERRILKGHKEELQQQLENWNTRESFLNKVTIFNYSKKLMEAINVIINNREKPKEYVFTICGTTFEGRTFERWVDTTPVDPSGCSSWGDATGYYRTEKEPDTLLKFFVVMEKDNFEIFNKMSFSNAKDYTRNLEVLARGDKDLVLKTFDLSRIVQLFPYIEDFLELLVRKRMELENVNLDDAAIDEVLKQYLATTDLTRNRRKD